MQSLTFFSDTTECFDISILSDNTIEELESFSLSLTSADAEVINARDTITVSIVEGVLLIITVNIFHLIFLELMSNLEEEWSLFGWFTHELLEF